MEVPRERHPILRRWVGASAAMQTVLADLVRVAASNCPVLLQGESGTGKELAARIIHDLSSRGREPFEAVNCGGMPETLVESELFGHVAGAFTGATRAHRGAFERAGRGTLFLDELGEMPPAAQVKLLRVLQEGTMLPVGGEKVLRSEARVVAASNRDLLRDVERGRFREDLYYRLNVYPIRIPPLRARREDIPPLVMHFLVGYSAELGWPCPAIEEIALRRLMIYPYPGNVRELQNVVNALLIEAGGAERIEDHHVVAVFLRHRVHETNGRGEDEPEAALDGRRRRGSGEIGSWVLEELRRCHFNVALAEKVLAGRKSAGADRRHVPVGSRSGLSYYLDGECVRALVQEAMDCDAAAARLAGSAVLAPRVRRRVKRVEAAAIEALHRGGRTPAQRLEALRRAFAKLPEGYDEDLQRLAGGFERA